MLNSHKIPGVSLKSITTALLVAGVISLSACGGNDAAPVESVAPSVDAEPTQAAPKATFEEGKEYRVLEEAIDRPAGEVISLFWYGCPHCYDAKGMLEEWEKTADEQVSVTIAHTMIKDSWMFDAFVFYSAKQLDALDDIHGPYFELRREGTFPSDEIFTEFLEDFDLTVDDLNEVAGTQDDMDVREEFSKIEEAMDSKAVPAFLIGGKYVINLSEMGGWDKVPPLLDYLTELSLNEQ